MLNRFEAVEQTDGRRFARAPITTAVVGYGYWGPNLARNICESDDLRLLALCEQDGTRGDAFARRYPGVPVIGFPKGAGAKLAVYARETGIDAIGLDETIDPAWAMHVLPEGMPVQGNLDPLLLLAGGEALERRARWLIEAFAGRPHVFNLGHGIDKETPIAHVERLLGIIRAEG